MLVRNLNWLRGPNGWAPCRVLQFDLDLTKDPSLAPARWIAMRECWLSWFPALAGHLPVANPIAESGNGSDLSKEVPCAGLLLAQVVQQAVVELQRDVGTDVSFGAVRENAAPKSYRIAVEYEERPLAEACLQVVLQLGVAAREDGPYEFDVALARLHEIGNDVCLGPSTKAIVKAANERGIPWRRLSSGSLVQLGHGACHRRICTAETDRTSVIAENIAQDKQLTKVLLRAAGVPVPGGRPVTSPDDAWAAALEIGLPVVVKPRDGNHGRGVSLNLTTREQVRTAFPYALGEGTGVLVEKFACGGEHRLLVVGDRVVAASRGEPEQIVGDGTHTIEELVAELNRDPRRNEQWRSPLSPIALDPPALIMLEQQGYSSHSIPPSGSTVVLHRNGDYTTDETDEVHPEVAAQAVLAAKAVGLDIAGVDLIAANISVPLEPQHGMVVEVNAGPGLLMHVQPQIGRPRPVGDAIVATLFPLGHDGRVPLVAVADCDAGPAIASQVCRGLQQSGRVVGLAGRTGSSVDGKAISPCDATDCEGAAMLLLHPLVEAVVCEVSTTGIVEAGLGFDRCQTAVIANFGIRNSSRPSEAEGTVVPTEDDLAGARRALVRSVLPTGVAVLNADDPAVAALAEHCSGEVIYFSQNGSERLAWQHRVGGGRLVFVRAGKVLLAEGPKEQALISLSELQQGCFPSNGVLASPPAVDDITPLLAGIAAQWSLGLTTEAVRASLLSLGACPGMAPSVPTPEQRVSV